ncbi:Com family DNA-binding transcriptional regulator [Chromobacterium haemolyticum]|uniref:Com family DNA-binding transcriptional regulator n=1 Tax=Chromobacterium fluminis TaxID=3044269 RepID=A0ABX0LGG4_9NEIS|nr:Com family DNA-binding transcriptional regulator [Chromobacterium haemolyticum]NHR08028.1 Com family DNA-binding transcriptional regulator [Chromobacterium haemolyticum]
MNIIYSKEIRCGQCGRKLAEGAYLTLNIKCPRCRTLNHFQAKSHPDERHERPAT